MEYKKDEMKNWEEKWDILFSIECSLVWADPLKISGADTIEEHLGGKSFYQVIGVNKKYKRPSNILGHKIHRISLYKDNLNYMQKDKPLWFIPQQGRGTGDYNFFAWHNFWLIIDKDNLTKYDYVPFLKEDGSSYYEKETPMFIHNCKKISDDLFEESSNRILLDKSKWH